MSTFLKSPFVPTEVQQNLLYSFNKTDQHLFFRGETGSGKSFILAMYALNLARAVNSQGRPTTTTLILVPNPDLAMQYQYWITQILSSSVKDPTRAYRVVQAVYRTSEDGVEEEQEQRLKDFANPHVLISTPTRLLDLIAKDGGILDVENLKYIIIDEADEIIQPPAKVVVNKIRHSTPGEILLDWIFKKESSYPTKGYMRLIATSATLTTAFNTFITEKGWLGDSPVNAYKLVQPSTAHTTSQKVDHHVLMVSLEKSPTPDRQPDRVCIEPAELPHATLHHNIRTKAPREKDSQPPLNLEYPPNYLSIPAMQRILRETSTDKAIALIPHGASKADFVWACHYFGLMNAKELRFSLDHADRGFIEPENVRGGGPVVYVANSKDIRGLDLKAVGIVFIMGEFGSVEDYVHIAGRTGRRKLSGTVITLLEDTTPNLNQALLNTAVKLVRSGSRRGHWALPTIRFDLKALPGDEFEKIRSEAGIVTVTEEMREKEEREARAREEQMKWLQNEKDGEQEGVSDEIPTEEFERPVSFGMDRPIVLGKRPETNPVKPQPLLTESLDWRDALAQSLKESKLTRSSSAQEDTAKERVVVNEPPPEEEFEEEEMPEEKPVAMKSPPENTTTPPQLSPFPSKPAFPAAQYNAAWKDVKKHFETIRKQAQTEQSKNGQAPEVTLSPETPTSETKHDTVVAPDALLANQAVLRRQDTPVIPHDTDLTPESGPDALKAVMEGESLRQVEESHLLAPQPSENQAQNVIVEVKKKRRGRPRKNTTNVVA